MSCAAVQALAATPTWEHRLVGQFTHDRAAWTEGLLITHGKIIESDGLTGQSHITETPLRGSTPTLRIEMSPDDYAEGIALVGSQLVQLTWQQGVGHLYDLALHPKGNFRLAGESWGLTFDGHHLILSDGSDILHFLRADGDYAETGRVRVHDGDRPVEQLNELEYADGLVYANVWHTDRVAVIEPLDGSVRAWLDFSDLHELVAGTVGWDFEGATLNGIAYDAASGHFFITGKLWPKLFEVEVLHGHAPHP